eukprot:CAMPEP_0201572136 /NCGR_PEP_ID=MMETSP0190_2-20130828/15242_1 /ASSEMBLY_ACC=CAM_ASM_000263 /TAXON_ID=37353 /ORGANISM="Rosalina sp." /LENGTH=552 /DNA_ID=CAMNT_0047997527 /DNA_START=28 /DNA_END=1686 /DNA_ORIENTATION=-
MSSESKIDLADQALSRYYKQCNCQYFDDDGHGKFKQWVDDNGFDTDGIEEEFVEQPEESQLIEVDDDFPSARGTTLSKEEMIEVLRKCWTDPATAYTTDITYEPIEIMPNHWDISKDDIASISQILQVQCSKIFDSKFQEDKSILKLLCVGEKINKPYLQFICDSYSRDRVEAEYTGKKVIIPNVWTQSNSHCKKLRDLKVVKGANANTPLDDAEGAIKSFFHRISPQLMLKPPQKIVDSLSQTSQQIAAAIDFVYSLVNNQKLAVPFQFDCTFAFGAITEGQEMVGVSDDEEEEEDDTDSEDEDDEKMAFEDVFGNIKDRLSHEKLPFVHTAINDDGNKDSGSIKQARAFKEQFNKFKTDKVQSDEFPQRHRFCAVIDRRNEDKGKGIMEDDELIIYLPPENCQKFPKDHNPMFYFGTSRACILPNKGYNNGDNPNDDITHKDAKKLNNNSKPKQMNITSGIGCNGAMLLLSFHVEAQDEIRCYMYLNGQVLRFLPGDIIKVLPRFFDSKFGDNETFPESEEAQQLIDEMDKKLRDEHFMAFYNAYKSSGK